MFKDVLHKIEGVKTMKHLKHNGEFVVGSINNSDKEYWRLVAKDRTQCWLVIGGSVETTDSIGDVTCPECVEAYGLGL